MKKLLDNKTSLLIYIFFSALVLRLLLSPYYTHNYDMGTWKYWAYNLVNYGFPDYFNKISWSDYLPFYYYILYIAEIMNRFLETSSDLTFKIPAILADLGAGLLIYLITFRYEFKKRIILMCSYLFNPAFFANSAMWGQVDGIGAFLMLLTLYAFIKNKLILLGIALSMAVLFKPLYLIAVPIYLLVQFKRDFKKIPILLASLAITSFLIAAPFTTNVLNTPLLIYERYTSSLGQYHYASVNAFNFWAMMDQNWKSDEATFLQITYHTWGLLLFAIFYGTSLLVLLIEKYDDVRTQNTLTFVLALVFLAIYTFATRVHERHLLTALPFLSLLLYTHWIFLMSFITLSLTYVANLYFGIEYLYQSGKYIFSNFTVRLYSFIPVLISVVLLVNSLPLIFRKLILRKNE